MRGEGITEEEKAAFVERGYTLFPAMRPKAEEAAEPKP